MGDCCGLIETFPTAAGLRPTCWQMEVMAADRAIEEIMELQSKGLIDKESLRCFEMFKN